MKKKPRRKKRNDKKEEEKMNRDLIEKETKKGEDKTFL